MASHPPYYIMSQYLALIAICISGAMLQATIGFGFPIFAMIFLVMIFPFSTAVTICQFAGILGVAYFFFKYWKYVQWKILLPFLVPALVIGVFLTWYSAKLPVSQLKFCLGVALVVIAVFLFFGSDKVALKPSAWSGGIMGAVSGVLNGVFAMGGPPVALYLLPAIGEKIAYIATANAYFFIFKVFSLPIRFLNGSVTTEHLGFLAVSLVSMTVGTVIGDRIMRKIPSGILKKLVYLFVGISGIVIIFQELL